MNQRIKGCNIGNFLFYIGYFSFLVTIMCNRIIYLNNVMGYIFYGSLILLTISIIITYQSDFSIKKNEVVKFVFILVALIVTYYITDDSSMMMLFILSIAAKNIKFKEIIKKDMVFKIFLVLFVFINYKKGLTQNISIYRNGQVRGAMGFSHPNIFGFYIMIIYSEYMLLRKGNIKWYDFLITFICFFIVNNYSESRTSMYIIVLIFIIKLLKKIIIQVVKNSKVIVKRMIKNLFLIMFFGTIIFNIGYKNGNFENINKAMAGRLRYNQYYLENYGITLFGQDIEYVSTVQAIERHVSARILDNSFLYIYLNYGIFSFVIFYLMYRSTLKNLMKKEEYDIVLFLIILTIYGFMESYFFKIGYNAYLFTFSEGLFYLNREEKNEPNKEELFV